METAKILYKIIEFERYDVLVPFICHTCGKCCHNFAPQIPEEDFPEITRYLNKPQEEIIKQHDECYQKKFTDEPANCSFLNNENLCMIYPLRPRCCRLYPFTDFGGAGVDCPGHKEFYAIVDILFADQVYAAMYNPEDYQKDKIRYVPDLEWPTILRKFMQAKPSEPMMLEFKKMNRPLV
ncbi:MAG: hypothetical protein A2132_05975 [Nitrospirae bacterium RBG_16_43_11]|nr:MAG: hypothetical protein A2132_05975 [Nitrospirae bacterium RBG_16_43_11]